MKRRIVYMAVALLCVASVFAGGRKRTQETSGIPYPGYAGCDSVTYYYTTGIVKETAFGDAEQALEMYAEAIKADSSFAPAYYRSAGLTAFTDMAKALSYSRKANSLDSTNVWYKAQLGRLLIMNDDYEEALGIYTELVNIVPNNPDNYRLLAALHDETGQTFAAIAILDSAEYKLGRAEDLSSFKRDLLMKVKLYDKAIEEARGLIVDYPYKPDNYLFLGKVYSQMGRDSLARANYAKAMELAPDDEGVLGELNDYYRRKGDVFNFLATAKKLFMSDVITLDAKAAFYEDITADRDFYRDNFFQIKDLAGALLLKYPYRKKAMDIYASNLIVTGDVEGALSFYKGYLSDTADVALYNSILDIESYLNRPDSVIFYARTALESYPDNTDIYTRLGSSMMYMKDYDGALKAFRSGLKHAASDSVRSVLYGMMGDVRYMEGKSSKGYADYSRALDYWPDNVLVLNNYAYYLSEEGRDLDKALEMAERVGKLSPGVATYMDTHGWILYKLGRYEEARKLVQQAVSLDRSGSHVLYMHYGDILYKLGDGFMASYYWRKAAESGAEESEVAGRLKLLEDNK